MKTFQDYLMSKDNFLENSDDSQSLDIIMEAIRDIGASRSGSLINFLNHHAPQINPEKYHFGMFDSHVKSLMKSDFRPKDQDASPPLGNATGKEKAGRTPEYISSPSADFPSPQ